jgi:hypothetical protein
VPSSPEVLALLVGGPFNGQTVTIPGDASGLVTLIRPRRDRFVSELPSFRGWVEPDGGPDRIRYDRADSRLRYFPEWIDVHGRELRAILVAPSVRVKALRWAWRDMGKPRPDHPYPEPEQQGRHERELRRWEERRAHEEDHVRRQLADDHARYRVVSAVLREDDEGDPWGTFPPLSPFGQASVLFEWLVDLTPEQLEEERLEEQRQRQAREAQENADRITREEALAAVRANERELEDRVGAEAWRRLTAPDPEPAEDPRTQEDYETDLELGVGLPTDTPGAKPDETGAQK